MHVDARYASLYDTRPMISVVDQHASQFRMRPEECPLRLSRQWDLHSEPVRWAKGAGAVSRCFRFLCLPPFQNASTQMWIADDGASGNDERGQGGC